MIVPGEWIRDNANVVRNLIKKVGEADKRIKPVVYTIMPIDPGAAGKAQYLSISQMMAGHRIEGIRESGPKDVRAEPLSASWTDGHVDVVRNKWTDRFLSEMEAFPSGAHDDYIDAAAKAFDKVAAKASREEKFRALAS